jgi:hypothetical protein
MGCRKGVAVGTQKPQIEEPIVPVFPIDVIDFEGDGEVFPPDSMAAIALIWHSEVSKGAAQDVGSRAPLALYA